MSTETYQTLTHTVGTFVILMSTETYQTLTHTVGTFVILMSTETYQTLTHTVGTFVILMSTETYQTLTHTVGTFVILIRELLQHNVLKSIITDKFQTDQLESRFGQYRQLSGSKYLVAVSDVSRSEKKMTVKRLLKLYSASKIIISIRTYLEKFNYLQPGKIRRFLKPFIYDTRDTFCVKGDDLSHLLLVSGLVARKTMGKT